MAVVYSRPLLRREEAGKISQAKGKHHGTVTLRDKADSDQRGQANYGMTGCLSFSSPYDFLAGDEMKDRSLAG